MCRLAASMPHAHCALDLAKCFVHASFSKTGERRHGIKKEYTNMKSENAFRTSGRLFRFYLLLLFSR